MTSPSTLIPSPQNADADAVVIKPSSHLLLETETDDVLVGLAVVGDTVAFEVLVHRYRPALHGFAIRTLGATVEADDVVQEALIAAWNKLSTLNDPEMVKSWLMRVVRNKCMDRLRATKAKHAELDDTVAAPARFGPFEVVSSALQNEALQTVLAALPLNQRRVWEMRELSGYSYTDIATEMDMTLARVRGLLARARHNLSDQMKSWR